MSGVAVTDCFRWRFLKGFIMFANSRLTLTFQWWRVWTRLRSAFVYERAGWMGGERGRKREKKRQVRQSGTNTAPAYNNIFVLHPFNAQNQSKQAH